MIRRTDITVITALLLMVALAVPAGATLTTIGTATYGSTNYNLIYETGGPGGPIVWLDYTNTYGNWSNQVAWASGLNNAGVLTYNFLPGYSMNWGSAWQLPTTVDGPYVFGYDGTTTAGYNITSSQLGYLYYTELGNQAGVGLVNTGPFNNLVNYGYWSGTESSAIPGNAWYLDATTGRQDSGSENGISALGIADRPGQLEIAPVPEPSTMLLLGVGLAGVVGLCYRRRRY